MGPIVGDHDNMKTPHVLVIPFISQGHIFSMLRLATQLRRRGVIVTVVGTEDITSGFNSADGDRSSSELQGLDFQFVARPPLEGGEGRRPGSGFVSERLKEALKPITEKLIRDKRAGIAGPTSIISDVFLHWTQVRCKIW
jgi:hypothetical protein